MPGVATKTRPPTRFSDDWLSEMDGRLTRVQLIKARLREYASDLGGAGTLSYAQRSLMRRWVQSVNALLGLFRTLGLQRQTKRVDLRDYVAQRYGT